MSSGHSVRPPRRPGSSKQRRTEAVVREKRSLGASDLARATSARDMLGGHSACCLGVVMKGTSALP